MSIKPIVTIPKETYGEPHPLRKPCHPVTDFGGKFQQELGDLIDTFWSHNVAIGLAAPQIGIPLRFAIINIERNREKPMFVIVNPKITNLGAETDTKRESCMSFPPYGGEVKRSKELTLSYQDEHGENKELHVKGFLARVIQHEVDHLDGFLYVDRMESISDLVETDIFDRD
ncbi:TPA: peptide deformylase [Candidatus Saccharibacteria bacterium]|nr:peptide deformylase [Candidatus Saccharibacteria bacterium]